MMNAVMQRPLFRQTGSPDVGEQSTFNIQSLLEDMRSNEGMRNIIGNKEADNVKGQLLDLLRKQTLVGNEELDSFTRNLMNPEFQDFMINEVTGGKQILETLLLQGNTPENFSVLVPLLNDFTAFKAKKESGEKGVLPPRDDVLSEEELNFLERIGPARMPNEPTINLRLMAKGGESDAVGIADGLDQKEPMTVDRDPSKEGIAKVSPEQYVELMNDVRGDEVSMEGRVQELASVVGEKDAQDTPLSVLALVQPVFEMKEQQGIAQTQGAQNMMPRASDQLANPQNMGIVRAQSGLIVDAPFNFRNMPSVSIQGDSTFANTIPLTGTPTPTATPNFMDTSNTLISDFMKQYVTPVKMDAATLQSEIDLLKGIMGDSKKEGQRALATTGVDLGLRLAAGEDINSLLREASANLFKITKAVKDADKAIALQAYKSLLSRKNTMSEREFNLAKLGLENQLKMLFEQSKGMEKPTYLRDPKSGKVIVLDQIRDAKKIADLLDGGFVPVSATAQQPILEQTFTTVQENKDGGEIVKRSTGSNQNGEQSGGSLTYEEAMEGIQSGEMGVPFEQQFGQGGMELIKDKATITKYQNRIILGQELEDLLLESISLIENNPKLAGLVGDAIQVAQKGVLPINQLFEVFGGTSPIPERVTEFLSDPAIQRLSTLEQLIPEKLINFQKDISSNRIPAMNRIFDQRGKLNISGFSDATRAVNTLKGILADVRDGSNMMREAIGRDPVPYGSKLDMILQQFNLTKDDDLVKQALDAIEQKPEAESQILDSLLEKLKQQSGQ
jgi:hypothetical protein